MSLGQAIDPASPQHVVIATMLALGRRHKDIAADLGYSAQYIGVLARDPAMRLRVESLQTELHDNTVLSLQAAIEREGHPSLETLRHIREGTAKPDPVVANVAKYLLDRALPPVKVVDEQKIIRMEVSEGAMKLMQLALAQADGSTHPGGTIDVEPHRVHGDPSADNGRRSAGDSLLLDHGCDAGVRLDTGTSDGTMESRVEDGGPTAGSPGRAPSLPADPLGGPDE